MKQIFLIITMIAIQMNVFAQKNESMKLTYIMDAQCGWCYANGNNIADVFEKYKDQIDIEIMVGGMWLGDNAPVGGEQLSGFISENAPRLIDVTGAAFGDAYFELIKDEHYTFESFKPDAAIVLVKQIAPKKAFVFAKKVQSALYLDGEKLDQLDTYLPILEALEIDKTQFEKKWMSELNVAATQAEFDKVDGLVSGFPTLILEQNGENKVLASGYFDLEQMLKKIESALND